MAYAVHMRSAAEREHRRLQGHIRQRINRHLLQLESELQEWKNWLVAQIRGVFAWETIAFFMRLTIRISVLSSTVLLIVATYISTKK